MELTKEQLEILVDGFRQHDLTKEVPLPTEKVLSGELKPRYSPLEKRIINRVVTVVNEEVTSVLMQGQQFTALNEISHEIPVHEDFENTRNVDAINFHNQWTHCKTAVGAKLSLDDEDNPIDEPPSDDDPVFTVICKGFCETLNDTDAAIFRMREDGYTQAEIAAYLRYKNHTAITKRLHSIKKRWEEFMNEHEPQQ